MTPILHTPRLTLRPRVAHDADALFATMANEAALRWWSRAPVRSVEELRAHFAVRDPDWRAWGVRRTGDHHTMGFVVAGRKRHDGVSEIGYLFARENRGKGIAREAVSAVITRLFDEGQRRVFADTDTDNAGSIRLLERLGFTRERRRIGTTRTVGPHASSIYGLLKGEWSA